MIKNILVGSILLASLVGCGGGGSTPSGTASPGGSKGTPTGPATPMHNGTPVAPGTGLTPTGTPAAH